MADDKIVIKIELDDQDIKKSFSEVDAEGKQTAEALEQSFNESLEKINAESLKNINDSLKKINSTIEKNAKAQDSLSEGVRKNTQFFADLSSTIETVADNFGLILTVLKATGKISDELASQLKTMVESFDIFKEDKSLDSFKEFASTLIPILVGSELLEQVFKRFGPQILFVIKKLGLTSEVIALLTAKFKGFGIAIASVGTGLFAIGKVGKDLGKTLSGIGQVFFGNTKNVFGFTTALAGLAAGLGILGTTFEKSNNEIVRIGAELSIVASILIGGFAAAITFAVIKIGEFAFRVGTVLVNSFRAAAESFSVAERNLVIFTKTIETFDRVTEGATGTTAQWSLLVGELSDELNLSTGALQRASSEIVAIGAKLGLAGEQQRQLLGVVSEFAKITGKDVFNASVAFVGALNGNAQAVTAYGVKLTEASNQQFLFKQGLNENFSTLSDGRKVQVRFNNLLSQYDDVAGLAASASGTLSEQSAKLKINQDRLNTSLGKGAALIEANNIGALALNSVLDNVNSTVIEGAGFIGALGSRILQITGLMFKLSFQVFAVAKGIKLLNVLLASSTLQSAFAKSIPLLGISFNQVLKSVVGTNVSLTKTGDIVKIFVSVFKNQLKILPIIFKNIASRVGSLLIAFAPLIAKFILIGAVIQVVVTAIKQLEERTQIFSGLIAVFRKELTDSNSVLSSLKETFVGFGNFLAVVFNKVIGLTIFSLSGLLRLFNSLAKANPFGLLSRESVKSIGDLDRRLDKLNEQLIANKFSLVDFGKIAAASTGEINKVVKVGIDSIFRLQDELKNAGKTQLQIINEQQELRLSLITLALEQEVITQKLFEDIKTKILADAEAKRAAIRQKAADDGQKSQTALLGAAQRSAVGVTSLVTQALSSALIKGKSAFDDIGGAIGNLLGNIAIQTGETLLAIGFGIDAIRNSILLLTGGPAIAAGIALIALGGLLKSLSGGGAGVTSTGAGVAPAGDDGTNIVDDNFGDQDLERSTAVTVNVEGQILDPIGAATQIAELLAEVTDSNDIRVNTA